MKASLLLVVLLLPILVAHGATVTPVLKALELLKGMLGQVKTARHEEQVQYAGYSQFCSGVEVEKQGAIQKADAKIETLTAHVQKFDMTAERLQGEIQGHTGDMAAWANDTDAAAAAREVERADYMAMHRNYSESIQAIGQAISFLKEQAHDRPGAAMLAQKAVTAVADQLSASAGHAIAAFLARSSEEPDLTFVAAPAADAYESRSHGIISMLEGLKDTFRDKLAELEKEEVARRHAHETVTQDLKHNIDAGKNDVGSKTKYMAKAHQDSTDASAALSDVKGTRADDAAYLANLVSTCQLKAADYESRQKLRVEEIEALGKAVDILSGTAVSGVAEKHLPKAAALQRNVAASLAQMLRGNATPANQLKAAQLLSEASRRLGSRTLSAMAEQAREDPFGKVKQLLEELVQRLLAQAGEEAEHKGWCDTELGTNEHTRTTKSEEVETLTAECDMLQSAIALLKRDLAELSSAVAQINVDVAKEASLRTAEKAQNEQTLQEARDAQTALVEAISILKDFYGKAAEATALVQGQGHQMQKGRKGQEGRQPAPPIFDTPYQGLGAESGGVLGMMEVIQSDFARLEQNTATSEAAATEEYDQFMSASAVSKAQKEKDIEHMSAEQQSKEMELLEQQSALENAGQEFAAAKATFEKLKPACLDTGMTYGERVGRRRDEIEALKQALAILSGEDAAVVQGVLVKDSQPSQLRSDITGLDYGN